MTLAELLDYIEATHFVLEGPCLDDDARQARAMLAWLGSRLRRDGITDPPPAREVETPAGSPPAREVDGLAPWEGAMQRWEPPNVRPVVTQLCSHNGTVLKGDEAMRSMQRVRRRKDDRRRKQKRKAG